MIDTNPQETGASRSLIAKAAEITGWTDGDIALIVGRSPAVVQSYRTGYRVEYLDGRARMNLLRCVRLYIDQAEQDYDELCRM